MAKVITGSALHRAIKQQTFIKGGSIECAEGIKYDFCMGHRVLKASLGQPTDMRNIGEAERSQMFVEPGEVVFVLTEEELLLPKNIMAELSPKRKLSIQGI